MKPIIPALTVYRTKVDAVTAAATLSRQITTSAGTHALTIPSSKGLRREFTVISTSGTATFTPVAPDTLVGLATVAANTSGTIRCLGRVWYRTAT